MNNSAARPLSAVPLPVLAVLIASLVIQVCWSHARPRAAATAEALPDAPDTRLLHLYGLGEPDALAKILMLWLQAFDNQPGVSIPFARLDYARVVNWLDALLDLDNRFQYPLLSASRVYTETPDDAGKRQMLEFVHRRFREDPERRWPWMAHAVYVAKHRIKDLQLALKYANALRPEREQRHCAPLGNTNGDIRTGRPGRDRERPHHHRRPAGKRSTGGQ